MSTYSNQQRISRDVNFTRWLFRVYLLLLFLLPLPLGSNRPIFWSLMVAGIALITLVRASGLATGVARWPGAVKRARWVLMPLGLFVVWGGVRVLGPLIGGGGWFRQSRPEAPPTGFFLGTVDWSGSADSLLLSIGLLLLALLTIVLVRSRRRAKPYLVPVYTLLGDPALHLQ